MESAAGQMTGGCWDVLLMLLRYAGKTYNTMKNKFNDIRVVHNRALHGGTRRGGFSCG